VSYPRDLKSSLIEKITLPLAVYTGDSATPTGVDMVEGDGLCNVAVYLGTIHADTTGAVTVEESDDDVTYTAVTLTGSATLTYTGTADGTVLRATFQRAKRYVRTPLASAGSTESAGVCVVVAEQKKFHS
jgi:hypothetical protein